MRAAAPDKFGPRPGRSRLLFEWSLDPLTSSRSDPSAHGAALNGEALGISLN
jgi:hypothetical protein